MRFDFAIQKGIRLRTTGRSAKAKIPQKRGDKSK